MYNFLLYSSQLPDSLFRSFSLPKDCLVFFNFIEALFLKTTTSRSVYQSPCNIADDVIPDEWTRAKDANVSREFGGQAIRIKRSIIATRWGQAAWMKTKENFSLLRAPCDLRLWKIHDIAHTNTRTHQHHLMNKRKSEWERREEGKKKNQFSLSMHSQLSWTRSVSSV